MNPRPLVRLIPSDHTERTICDRESELSVKVRDRPDLGEYESRHLTGERPESVRNMRTRIDPLTTARREDLFQVIVPFSS